LRADQLAVVAAEQMIAVGTYLLMMNLLRLACRDRICQRWIAA
jgi:hypothetical protein